MAEPEQPPQTATYRSWRKVGRNRLGRALFSLAVVARAPYFGTIAPTVTQLQPGHCEVTAPKWIGIHNHIGTFHAIAACNLAEMAMGMLCEATVPTTHRWIPKSMSVTYLRKAETGVTATARLTKTEWAGGPESVGVPVTVIDESGTEVVRAVITMYVTPKK